VGAGLNSDFDSSAKFHDLFSQLKGIDLPLEELDLTIRSFNLLKRSNINNLEQLLELSFNDIMLAQGGIYSEITITLQELAENYQEKRG
jgi:DNA-directed RNA polymerase alpha subunit